MNKPEIPSRVGSTALLGHVRMFKPQFSPMVEAGTKCQTVRPTPKRMPKPGDKISLRMWTGKPYRSKQRVLREATVSEVLPIRIDTISIILDGCLLSYERSYERIWEFAIADGFDTPQDMIEWFNVTHGLPFYGVVIKWHNDPS